MSAFLISPLRGAAAIVSFHLRGDHADNKSFTPRQLKFMQWYYEAVYAALSIVVKLLSIQAEESSDIIHQ